MKEDKLQKYVQQIRACDATLWQDKAPSLFSLDVELTERCDNNCIHCYINRPANDTKAKELELSTNKVKAILDEAASLGCLIVRFTGGEPLLREDFEEIYIFARKLGLKVLLFTSATLLTPHLAELFARIPPLQKIEITVYGMKRESYEAVTRTLGSFEASTKGMNLLKEMGIPFVVKFPVLPPNKEEMEEFETWASALPWMDRSPSFSMFFDLRGRRDSEEKNRFIRRLRPSPEEALKTLTGSSKTYVKEMKTFCSRFMFPPGEKLFSCNSGRGDVCVDAYGSLQPCMLLRDPEVAYDFNEGSLKDALTDFFPRMRRMEATDHDYLARCACCFLKGLCEQCPAKSWIEHGRLDNPVEYLCEMAHAQARYLGLLDEGEKGWKVKSWEERIKGFCSGDTL